jgi:hypothetical protein
MEGGSAVSQWYLGELPSPLPWLQILCVFSLPGGAGAGSSSSSWWLPQRTATGPRQPLLLC